MTHPFDELDQLAVLDAEISQLEHSRASLPARIELAEIEATRGEMATALAAVERQRAPLAASLEELEREVAALAQRRATIEQRLATATGASRDLAAMDAERRHLAELQEGLEDRELSIMEELEPLDAQVSASAALAAPLVDRREAVLGRLAIEEAGLDEELRDRQDRRVETAQLLEPALLARYEKLGARMGGPGATRLVEGHCGGCHLQLPTVELDQLNRQGLDEIATCEQCGRILIRPTQLGD